MTYHVYLSVKEKRLIISQSKVEKKYFVELLCTSGNNECILYKVCKTFCTAYICGTKFGKVINEVGEFSPVD